MKPRNSSNVKELLMNMPDDEIFELLNKIFNIALNDEGNEYDYEVIKAYEAEYYSLMLELLDDFIVAEYPDEEFDDIAVTYEMQYNGDNLVNEIKKLEHELIK